MLSLIKVKNNTDYYHPNRSRLYNVLFNPFGYTSMSMKRDSYNIRMYYAYDATIRKGGSVYFYTFTHNDSSLCKMYGYNVPDVRKVLMAIDAVRATLRRKYNISLDYFLATERGEGKGYRGYANNPHYHAIFFLNRGNYCYQKGAQKGLPIPYISINPVEFRRLLRLQWQGCDLPWYDRSSKQFRYGILREGDNCGVVSDFRAIGYVSKYVTKTKPSYCIDQYILDRILRSVTGRYCLTADYKFKSVDYEERVSCLNEDVLYAFLDYLVNHTSFDLDSVYHNDRMLDVLYGDLKRDDIDTFDTCTDSQRLEFLSRLVVLYETDYLAFIVPYVKEKVRLEQNDYRNFHSTKVRVSQGLGLSALDSAIVDDNGFDVVPVPTKTGFKYKMLPQYYLRKKYYDTLVDPNTGNTCYKINEAGVEWKVRTLCCRINSCIGHTENVLLSLVGPSGETLFNSILDYIKKNYFCTSSLTFGVYNGLFNGDVNYKNFYKYLINEGYLKDDKIDTSKLRDYAIYKKVYEYRCYDPTVCGSGIDPLADYKVYIRSSRDIVPYNPLGYSNFVKLELCKNYMEYSSHPHFAPNVGFYSFLDICSDYLRFFKDKENEEREEVSKRIRRNFENVKMGLLYKLGDNINVKSITYGFDDSLVLNDIT